MKLPNVNQKVIDMAESAKRNMPEREATAFIRGMAKIDPEGDTSRELMLMVQDAYKV